MDSANGIANASIDSDATLAASAGDIWWHRESHGHPADITADKADKLIKGGLESIVTKLMGEVSTLRGAPSRSCAAATPGAAAGRAAAAKGNRSSRLRAESLWS